MTHYLIDNQPTEWDQLAAVYDKDGAYKQNYIESKMREQMADTQLAAGNGEIVENGPNTETNDKN